MLSLMTTLTCLAWKVLDCVGYGGSGATPPGYMDNKPSALGAAVCCMAFGSPASQSSHLFGPPIWCMVEVLHLDQHSGASTNT